MSDVFVSYKAEDRRRVQPLVEALEHDGLSVWWDAHIGGGDEWRRSIEEQLDAARCVLVIWSKRSVGPEGRFVRDEASRAMERGVYLPVKIDAVRPPIGFGEMQSLSLIGWKGNLGDPRLRAVLAAVRATLAGEPPERRLHPTAPTGQISRRGAIAGGALAIAAAGLGGWLFLKPEAASASGSIAVLPFANLSGDPANDYFSDGLAEEIRNALARFATLEVVGRTSSEAVRNEDARTAADKLGVASILIGSVRRSPTTIRVSAQLIDGSTGMERWSHSYDRANGDTLAIQNDIARNVASALSIALGRSDALLMVGGTSNAAAQDLFLKAREQLRADDSEASYRLALSLFDAAIALDPKFANAYAQKSLALNAMTGIYSPEGGFAQGYGQSEKLAREAITLAPNSPVGRIALAKTLWHRLNLAAAYPEYQKALALSQGDLDVLIECSEFMTMLGNADEALRLARQAVHLDPLNPAAFQSESVALYCARQFPAAAEAARRGLQLAPDSTVLRTWLAYYLVGSDRYAEARAELGRVPANNIFRLTAGAVILAREGDRRGSDRLLERMRPIFGDTASYQYAQVRAQQGEVARAFAELDRAWAIRDPGLGMIRVDPWLDPLRGNATYAELEKKLNFPPASAIATA